MRFNVDSLKQLTCNNEPEGFEIVQEELVGFSRWSVDYELVFKFDNKFFMFEYCCDSESGLTGFENSEDGKIECKEVFPIKKTIIVYE